MVELERIIEAIEAEQVHVTHHARAEAIEDNLTAGEVIETIRSGEIIKHYPEDRPYPSCLIYSSDSLGEPLHSVWAYDVLKREAILVTVYRPDPGLWVNWRTRKER